MPEERFSLQFGALCPPLKEQLKGRKIPINRIRMFQKIHDAILMCWLHFVITDKEKDRAFDKLFKGIEKAIKEAQKWKKK